MCNSGCVIGQVKARKQLLAFLFMNQELALFMVIFGGLSNKAKTGHPQSDGCRCCSDNAALQIQVKQAGESAYKSGMALYDKVRTTIG